MSLIKDYFEKTKLYNDEYGNNTIVLIQVGAFFEVYGLKNGDEITSSNILDFSRICDLNVVDKRVCCGTFPVVMAGFKDHLLDKYIKKLQEAGFTIVVFEQDQQCANTTRSLTGIYSPGTYFSSDVETITNNTCCLWIETKKYLNKRDKDSNKKLNVFVGAAVIDIYTGTSCIMEYNEQYIRNPTTFDELERFISIYNPSETILISNLTHAEIDDIISFSNIKSKSIHIVNLNDTKHNFKNIQCAANCEKQIYQTQLLHKFYKIDDITSFMSIFNDNVYSTQSFCYLLDFIYQHNPNLIHKISIPELENSSNKLILANHSLKQLNIIDDENYKGKYSSVLKMLNECLTPMGKRTFSHMFLNPVTDENFLKKEYDIIEKILSNMDEYKVIKIMISNIKDLAKISRQIILKKVTPKSLYQLYCGVCSAKLLYDFCLDNYEIQKYIDNKIPHYSQLISEIVTIKDFIESVLIMEDCKDIDNIQKIEKSFIKPAFNQALDNKIQTLMESQDQLECCRYYFDSLISNYETGAKKNSKKKTTIKNDENDNDSSSYVKTHITEKYNFSLISTDRRCKILAEVLNKSVNKKTVLKYNSSYYNTVKEFTLDLSDDKIEFIKQSSTNKAITNNQIDTICKNVSSIKINLIETIGKVYLTILNSFEPYQDIIERICLFITTIDIVYAKAYLADKYHYCKPEICDNISDIDTQKSFIKVNDLRHCLIEKIQQTELYVANDLTIGDGKLDGVLLYGTNAVGKTSFIRALGISVIMAQAGLYVPASKYKFKPYKYIFTRIIGNDNLFKGLSTFAVEMSELRTILRLANKNSLVLGDELCSGTESISAVSIFVAGVQELQRSNSSFIFATHLHEIIHFDEITSLHNVGMKHMTVTYDKERDCLIYNRKLEDGPGNNMYGLEVCKSLNLPDKFLEAAHNIRLKYHPESESILSKKTSHFNSKHIKNLCEKCDKNPAEEVHHLIFQQESDKKGIVRKDSLSFHKNNAANLLSLCQACHDEIHKTKKTYKKTKTTRGTILEEL